MSKTKFEAAVLRYLIKGGFIKVKPEDVDWTKPITIGDLEHEPGYNYSEWTEDDQHVRMDVTYYIRNPNPGGFSSERSARLEDDDFAGLNFAKMLKGVLAIAEGTDE